MKVGEIEFVLYPPTIGYSIMLCILQLKSKQCFHPGAPKKYCSYAPDETNESEIAGLPSLLQVILKLRSREAMLNRHLKMRGIIIMIRTSKLEGIDQLDLITMIVE